MHRGQLAMGFVFAVLTVLLFSQTAVFASVSESMRGFAWGGTSSPPAQPGYDGIGWISMNNLSDGSGTSYGVNIPFSNGPLSGYAWSEHYGWISFNGADLSGCNPALSQASRSGNSITGGARIIAIRDAGVQAGGFDGCISLSGGGYGLSVSGSASPYSLSGYAWSSDLGWIDFSGVQVVYTASATISAVPCTIPAGSGSCQGQLTWDIQGAENPNVHNVTSNTSYGTGPTGVNVPVTLSYGTNDIAARNGNMSIQTITVSLTCASNSAWNSTVGLCVDSRPNFTQPNISYTPSTTFDPLTGEYDYLDVTFQTQNDGQSSTGVGAVYDIQIDRDNTGGYEDTESGTIAALAGGAYSTAMTERFTDVAFGSLRLRAALDTTNAVSEVNESDNERVVSGIFLPPPDPGVSIEADRTLLRHGESTVVRWSVSSPYPTLSCRVYGSGVDINPAPVTGNRATRPIAAKSEYTFSCTETTTNTTWTDTVSVESVGEVEEI